LEFPEWFLSGGYAEDEIAQDKNNSGNQFVVISVFTNATEGKSGCQPRLKW